MEEKGRDVEILVHITAPSRGKDDARYRALASAYLEFEPARTHYYSGHVEKVQSSPLNDGESSRLHIGLAQPLFEEPQEPPPNEAVLDGEDESYVTLLSEVETTTTRSYITRSSLHQCAIIDTTEVSFNSVDDNAGSFEFRGQEKSHSSVVVDESNSWSNQSCEIPDSQPLENRAIPGSYSPARLLELYLQHLKRPETPLPVATDGAESPARRNSQTISIMCSQRISAPNLAISRSSSTEIVIGTPTPERKRKPESSMHHISTKRHLSATSKDASHAKIISESFTTKFRYTESLSCGPPRSSLTSMPSSSAEKLPSPQRRELLHFMSSGQSACSKSPSKASCGTRNPRKIITPNEIHPPRPRTAQYAEISPVVPALEALTGSSILASKYTPLSKTRHLRDLERGFWSVSMATWGKERRNRAWKSLTAFVGGGRAGWGVWCSRNHSIQAEGESTGHDDGECTDVAIGYGGVMDELRLYCWGAVVKHTYLLLYLVSERRVRRSESKWIDGAGNTVIVMPVVAYAPVCSASGC